VACEKSSDERKGKGKNGVLELDHLERDLQLLPNLHLAIMNHSCKVAVFGGFAQLKSSLLTFRCRRDL